MKMTFFCYAIRFINGISRGTRIISIFQVSSV